MFDMAMEGGAMGSLFTRIAGRIQQLRKFPDFILEEDAKY
jgi:hypothetical protein